MLLVGDMHCTRRSTPPGIEWIERWVLSHEPTQSVIFLGDYVYHFSVDRVALRELLQLFLRLRGAGYTVYVLAGNHDRINNLFVFQQAQDLLEEIGEGVGSAGSISFITRPQRMSVDGTEVLFMPYSTCEYEQVVGEEGSIDQVPSQYREMMDSSTTKERLSGHANAIVDYYLTQRRSSYDEIRTNKLHIIHHRYTEGVAFPGQFAKFSYRSAALDRALLDQQDCILISGHLHKPFVERNYLCCGSVWYTSPLERNQRKYCFEYNPDTHQLTGSQLAVNPYIQIDYIQQIKGNALAQAIQTIEADMNDCLTGGVFSTTLHSCDLDRSAVTLHVRSSTMHERLDEYVDPMLMSQLKEVTVKHTSHRSMDEMMDSLQDASLRLGESIADWKVLLEQYGARKFAEQWPAYRKELEQLEIL